MFCISKTFAASRLAKRLFPELAQAGLLAGYAAVIGHIFPFYMGFKGGKGLAVFGGMILAADWRIFCVLLTVGLGLIVLTSWSVFCLCPLLCCFRCCCGSIPAAMRTSL